mgnify:CR=1 FL=1
MNPALESVLPLPDYKLQIHFKNGEKKLFDVTPFLDKGIFKELKEQSYFKSVKLDFSSVEWPNEQDFSKDSLYLLGVSQST